MIVDLNLCTSRGAVQSCGRSMGLAVVGERVLWLSLSGLSEKEMWIFLDAPVDPKTLFGSTVTTMHQQCDLRKKEEEAFKTCLPRKSAARPYQPAQVISMSQSKGGYTDYHSNRPPPPQHPDNVSSQPRSVQAKGKQSYAAATEKHRPSNP